MGRELFDVDNQGRFGPRCFVTAANPIEEQPDCIFRETDEIMSVMFGHLSVPR